MMPDGRFVGLIDLSETEAGRPRPSEIRVVFNWLEELKQRVPAR
jgi:hypothetical protein